MKITADIIVYIPNTYEILLIKRKFPPYENMYALPGGFVEETEKVKDAACRELFEETGIKTYRDDLETIMLSDEPNRDSRQRVITIVYLYQSFFKPQIKIQKEEVIDYTWASLFDIEEMNLAFDHKEIINQYAKTQSQIL